MISCFNAIAVLKLVVLSFHETIAVKKLVSFSKNEAIAVKKLRIFVRPFKTFKAVSERFFEIFRPSNRR